MYLVINKLSNVSYNEALHLREDLNRRVSRDSTEKVKTVKRRTSILFSIIQGPKLYA